MADDLEQQVSAGLVDGQVANFIKDKYTWSSVLAQLELELPGGLWPARVLITSTVEAKSTE